MEETEQFCNNCKRNVGAANFASHSAFCQRHITVCQVCDEAVPKNLKKEHEDEYHVSVSCDLCNISIQKWMVPKHKEMCPKRRVICEFCEGDFPFDEFREHDEFCGCRTEKCLLCSKYIMLKNKKEHSEYHMYGENINRQYGEVDQNIVNECISKKSEKGLKSNEKGNPIITDDFEFGSIIGAAASVPDKPKQESNDYIKCHLCKQFTLRSDYDDHICYRIPENELKCPNCEQFVPHFALKEHNSRTCPVLQNFATQISSSESRIQECSSSSSYASHDDLSDKRLITTQPCPICKKPYSSDGILEHMKSCLEKYFVCHLCNEKVLQADQDIHLSSNCKMLQEKIPLELYECPLCGERLPEKDKTRHESFSCKVLLEANEGPLYSLSQERCSRKTHKETQECMNRDPKHDLASHKQSCNNTAIKQCLYCDKEICVRSEENHLQICEVFNQIRTISGSERDFNNKGAKPKRTKFSEIVKPKVGKCTFCKTILNDNILLFHEKECVHQPIECSDCSKTVPLKDIESHFCKSRKGRGERKNQKSEKSESRNAWSLSNIGNIFGSSKPAAKTLDQHQNDRNQLFENHMGNKFAPYQVRSNEDLYFAQPLVDDTKIPCEFCDKLFPASEIVLHMTGCNPTVSLPKDISSVKAKKIDTNSQIRQGHDSAVASQKFFSVERPSSFLPSTKYDTIQNRLEQRFETKPGEYLGHYSEQSSIPERYSDYQTNRNQNHSSSTFKSVWNNDASDVEMEEVYPETNSSDPAREIQVKDNSEKLSGETEKHSVDSDDEVSSMLESIKDPSPSKSNTNTDIETKQYDNLKRYVSKAPGIQSHETDFQTYSNNIKSDCHKGIDFSSDEDEFEDANKASSSKLDTVTAKECVDTYAKMRGLTPVYSTVLYGPKDKSRGFVSTLKLDDKRYQSYPEIRLTKELAEEEAAKNAMAAIKEQRELIISKAGSNLKKEEPFKKAFRYILNTEENCVPDKVTEETIISTNIVHNKMENSEDDEFIHISRTDKFQSKKDVSRIDSESFNNIKKNQTTHNATETKPTLDKQKKMELSNFRFCGDRMKSSSNRKENVQNSETKEYDVYYKTNALGFVTVSNDEESVIRRPKKKDVAVVSQNNTFSSKFEYQNDNTIETRLDERVESRTQDVSSMPEKSTQMLRTKYEYWNDNVIEKNEKERTMSRIQGVSPSVSEKSFEMLRSKYSEGLADDVIQTSQKERFENKNQDASPSIPEKSIKQSKYYTVCPMCNETIRWIDFNMHVPACASAAGKCSRCGKEVSSSDLKEHFLVKCSKQYEKKLVFERSEEKLKSRITSYEQLVKSITLDENIDEKKSREQSENIRMKTSRNEEKMDYTKSNDSTKTTAKEAFSIEPVGRYWHPSGINNRKSMSNYEESAKEKQLERADKDPKRFSGEDVDKWCKWRSRSSDNS